MRTDISAGDPGDGAAIEDGPRLRRSGRPVWSGDPANLRIAGAELVGGWGLGPAWSDGHATGVHEWSVLRASCPCGACR